MKSLLNKSIKLSDVIEVETLQHIQDSFARAVGVGSIIIDCAGNLITTPSNFNPVCQLVQKSDKGRKNCELSDNERNQLASQSAGPIYHKCRSCGFIDASVPISVNDVRIGYWLIGQCRAETTDRDKLTYYLAEIGVDGTEVIKAFDALPVMTQEKMRSILDLLEKIVNYISTLAFKNLKLKEEVIIRSEAESKLRESESKYRATIESMGDAIHIVDRDCRIIYANNAFNTWASNLGVSVQLIGRSVFEVFPFLDENIRDEYELVFSTGNRLVTQETNKLGSLDITTETRKIPIDENGTVTKVVTIVRDITFQKRSEDELRKFKMTSDAANYGIAMTGLDGNLLYLNKAWAGMHQYRVHELMGKHLSFLHNREQIPEVKRLLKKLFAEKSFLAKEVWHRKKDGSVFPALMSAAIIENDQGVPQFLSVTMVDISDRIKAEEELRRERDMVSRLMELSPAGITVVDSEGQITFANQHAEKILRLSKARISSRTYNDPDWRITDFDGGSYPDDELPFAIVKRTGKSVYGVQHAIQLDDDEKVLLSINASPIMDDNGNFKGMVATIEDITERKLIERTLLESERKFRNIIEASPMGMHLYYVDDEGRLIFEGANPAADKILGIANSQFIGKTCEEAFPPLADSEIPIRYRQAASEGTVWQTEQVVYKHDRIDGAFDVVAFQTSPGRMAATFLDVTERKRAEHAVEKSQKQYHELFNSVMEGIAILDEKEIVRFANPAFGRILEEKSVADIIGKSFLDYFNANQRELILKETDKRKRGQSSQYELEIITARGNKKNVYAYITPRFDDEGNHSGSYGTILDVTITRRLQEFTARALRLETAGRIAAQVAHDFNNLLGPLIAYPEILREFIQDNTEAHEMLDDIEKSALSMADINQQLLTLGRRGHYSQEVLSLNDIVRQAIREIEPLPGPLKIDFNLEENLKPIKGGTSQIHRVISNLIRNARDAMHDRGNLVLTTENYRCNKSSGQYFRIPPGQYARLSVSDSGTGISTEILPHVFEPFFTTKSTDKSRGSGLGLSIVQAVMEDHGGYVDLESEAGKGTKFSLYFPPTDSVEGIKDSADISGGEETILVVDDDAQQRKVTEMLLEKLGYRVKTAANGEVALRIIKHHQPDLLILDMILQDDLDGAEIFKRARQIYPDIKAIIVSGYAESARVAAAKILGAGQFIKKPLTIKSLAKAVRCELDKSYQTETAN